MTPPALRETATLALALATTIAVPLWLLHDRTPPAPAARPAPPPPAAPVPPLAAALDRPLFGGDAPQLVPATDPATAGADDTPPAIVGIVGRLPDDAVALVRTPAGRTRSLAVGDSLDGWRLASLAPEAALFTRGPERRRVDLPPAR